MAVRKLTDKDFRYNNAEASRKPGYLARRFAQIRKEQAEAARNTNVQPISKKKVEK